MYEWGLSHLVPPRPFVPRLAVREAALASLTTRTDIQPPGAFQSLSEEDSI